MNTNEGVHRIAIVLRAAGVVITLLGVIGIAGQSPGGHLIPILTMTAVLAAPFFVVAWIVEGFASRQQKELDAMLTEWRRCAELGRRALDSHPEA